MRHKRFVYRCPVCKETGLRPDDRALYKVCVCEVCTGAGKLRQTVQQRISWDGPRTARGGQLNA